MPLVAILHDLIRRGFGSALLLMLLSISVVAAQSVTCPDFVERAIDAVSTTCPELGRNELCYGNNAIEAEFVQTVQFALPGDRANIVDLARLVTAPLQPDTNIWGVAVLSLQADLPDTLPGQNATFIVFGDTELTPDTTAPNYGAPMQAFTLETRLTGLECGEVPESGLLVQAPTDTTVNFLINGIEVKVGSSAMLQIDADELVVDTIEGFVEVTSAGETEVAGEGVSVRARRGQRPGRAALNRERRVANAPWRLLPRQVRSPLPPPEGQQVELNQCFFITATRPNRSPVARVTAGEPIVLKLNIPHQSLDIARVLLRRAETRLLVNGVETPRYTRIGPWHGQDGAYANTFGIELYWLLEPATAGDIEVVLQSRSVTGRPINTGIDGPDADYRPEIIPAYREVTCTIRVS